MEKLVAELQKIVMFKDTTEVGDIVLIAAKKPQLLVYALIMDIERDTTKLDEWWQVTMQILTVPPHQVVWVLRTPQMTGMEIFTMGGEQRFVKAIDVSGSPVDRMRSDKRKTGRPALRRVK